MIGGALSLLIAWNPFRAPVDLSYIQVWEYALLGVFVLGMMYTIVRRRNARIAWEMVSAIGAVVGVWYLMASVLPMWIAILTASVFTCCAIYIRSVQFLFSILGALGIAVAFATWMPIEVLLVGLAGLTLYDMVAGLHGHAIRGLIRNESEKIFLPRIAYRDRSGAEEVIGIAHLVLPYAIILAMLPFGWIASILTLLGASIGAWIAFVRPDPLRVEWTAIGTAGSAVGILLFYAIV